MSFKSTYEILEQNHYSSNTCNKINLKHFHEDFSLGIRILIHNSRSFLFDILGNGKTACIRVEFNLLLNRALALASEGY